MTHHDSPCRFALACARRCSTACVTRRARFPAREGGRAGEEGTGIQGNRHSTPCDRTRKEGNLLPSPGYHHTLASQSSVSSGRQPTVASDLRSRNRPKGTSSFAWLVCSQRFTWI